MDAALAESALSFTEPYVPAYDKLKMVKALAAPDIRQRLAAEAGEGQLIEVAMLDALSFLLFGYYGPAYLADGRVHQRRGVRSPFIVSYGTFEASDGSLVLVGRTEKQGE